MSPFPRSLQSLADFSGPEAHLPAPNTFNPIDLKSSCSPRAILFQTYNRDMAALETIYRWRQTAEIVEVKLEVSLEEEEEKEENQVKTSCPIKSDREELESKAVSTIRATESHTDSDMASMLSSTERVTIPLKKRVRMLEVPYAIGHVIK